VVLLILLLFSLRIYIKLEDIVGNLQMLIAVVSVPKWLTLLRVIRWSVAIKEAAL